MDRVEQLEQQRVRIGPEAKTEPGPAFDFGAWCFRWFGAGIAEQWLGHGDSTVAQLWAQRMLDTAMTHGS